MLPRFQIFSSVAATSLVREVADAYGIPFEVALLMQSSMLAGIGGSDLLRSAYATCPIVLAAEAQAETRFSDKLSMDLRYIHRGLSNKRRYLKARRPLDLIAMEGKPWLPNYLADAAEPGASSQDYTLLQCESPEYFQEPQEELRLEAILRPGFLVESCAPEELKRLLPRCHRCEGYFVDSGSTALPREERKRRAWADQLCEFLDGKALPGVENLDPDGGNETVVARLQMIMRLGHEARHWIATRHSGLLSKCLFVPITMGSPPGAESSLDAAAMGSYWNILFDVFRQALARRRSGHPPFDGKAGGEERELEFLAKYRGYSHFIASDAILAGCAPLARLPEFLAMGLRALGGKEMVEGLVEIVFDAARRLAEAHRREVLSHLHRDRMQDFVATATKIVHVVGRKQPVTLRDLVRSFDQQRTSIYAPVVDQLLEHQILKGDPRSGLCLGPRLLREVNLNIVAISQLVGES